MLIQMSTDEIINAHFFFVDIVSGADPVLPIKKQVERIKALNNLIASCDVFKNTNPDSVIVLPTGDGMAIGFKQGPQLPLELAIELHKQLHKYNKGMFPEEALRIRIGLNDGVVFIVRDVRGNPNVWGDGIIYARRVMDIGDDGHILLSSHMAETLRKLSDRYKVLIKRLRDYMIKHNESMLLYSAFGKVDNVMVGNSKEPSTKPFDESRIGPYVRDAKLKMLNAVTDVTLTLTDPMTLLTHHKHVHKVEVISDKPVETVLLGIGTDVEKSFDDLKIKTYDETGREMSVTSINMDRPHNKEFTISFNKPVYKGEKNRVYTLEYDVEERERFFEDKFSIDCKKFNLYFVCPSDTGFNPALYEMDADSGKKLRKIKPASAEQQNSSLKMSWTKTNLLEGQCVRLEW